MSGFLGAEGCFHIAIIKASNLKLGVSVRAIFQISLARKDKVLLEKIRCFFGVGHVSGRKDGAVVYNVSSIKDLQVILEHLENYPLISDKWADVELFKQGTSLCIKISFQRSAREKFLPKGLEHWKLKHRASKTTEGAALEYYLNIKSTNGKFNHPLAKLEARGGTPPSATTGGGWGPLKTNLCLGKKSYSTLRGVGISPPQARKIYKNADIDKLHIITENKGKAGVYRWINIANGKSYIGSSVDLGRRLKDYFTLGYLEFGIKKSQSHIYKSLLKNGYSNFSFEILEYCEPEKAIEREQHYIDLFQPEYNILKKAGSLYGFKHSEETKAKFKIRSSKQLEHWKNLLANPEEQARRLEHIKRIHLSNKGRARPEGAGTPSVSIEVLDTLTDQITVYTSISEAARAIGVGKSSIGIAFKRQEEKGVSTVWIKNKRYQITKIRSI